MLLFHLACTGAPRSLSVDDLVADTSASAEDTAQDSGTSTDTAVTATTDSQGDTDAPVDTTDTGCPEGTVDVDGACLPSCGGAGGDTCTDSSTTLCDGLPALASYDCALCCDRSVYPSPAPASFHIVDRDDIYSYDSVQSMVETYSGPMICAQNQPAGLDPLLWAQKINATWYSDGDALADAIHAALVVTDPHPRMVMVDELRSDTHDLVDAAALRMATVYPQWRGHWGVFLVNGEAVSYANLQPAVDDVLDAGAAISVEFYPAQSTYCASASSAGERDEWLAEFFSGSSTLARFNWLRERRDGRGSTSDLSTIFGTTDTYMDGTYPAWFLDRMFYVWVTRTDHADLFTWSAGGAGPGAYKWDDPTMSNTSRDLAFVESWIHYVYTGDTSSREGQVECD